MSSASELVTDACSLLGVLDINELAPSPAETEKGLRALNQMIDSWAIEGLAIKDVTRTCTIVLDDATITEPIDPLTGLTDTFSLALGMNASGTGLPVGTRIRSFNDLSKSLLLDQLPTVSGTSVTVSFSALPFEPKFERGVAAMLALELAAPFGAEPPAWVAKVAQSGWVAIQANFMRIPPVGFDPMLTQTSMRRAAVINTNG